MAHAGSKGKVIYGSVAVDAGDINVHGGGELYMNGGDIVVSGGKLTLQNHFSSIVMTSVTITPGNSAVGATRTEERGYTTGLTALGLKANDVIQLSPRTTLASNLAIGGVAVRSANTVRILWVNPNAATTQGFAQRYDILVFHRT